VKVGSVQADPSAGIAKAVHTSLLERTPSSNDELLILDAADNFSLKHTTKALFRESLGLPHGRRYLSGEWYMCNSSGSSRTLPDPAVDNDLYYEANCTFASPFILTDTVTITELATVATVGGGSAYLCIWSDLDGKPGKTLCNTDEMNAPAGVFSGRVGPYVGGGYRPGHVTLTAGLYWVGCAQHDFTSQLLCVDPNSIDLSHTPLGSTVPDAAFMKEFCGYRGHAGSSQIPSDFSASSTAKIAPKVAFRVA
jgi:hypothetical protein